ncbi:glycosyl transferase family 28 [Prauserella marina]|uniref:L-2-deoxyfucosyltransferase n=1 Tax=Prauserella marina TaxID=530584 RepID=A0A222VLU1_9PSEU|nr:activator-dependent family glycosyltransferase [Prauserella marina]ASR34888.1 glycosyl transferase family 28 [Prauserella marina]PWV85410.1 L-2-deoxyfucosyltransferase [Prauserella marina]SDC55494.1 L-2-deoxyfucosyltransferase [Prauserella marina]
MRVLFTTFAAKAHLYTQVPMAWALHTAGHDVVVASQPDLTDDITGTGLTAVPVGEVFNLEGGMRKLDGILGEVASGRLTGAQVGLDMSETRPEKLTWDYLLHVFSAMTPVTFLNHSQDSMIDELAAFAREWRPDLVLWDPLTFAGAVVAKVCGAAHARMLFGPDLVGRMRSTFLDQLARRPPELSDDPLAEWFGWTLDRLGRADGFTEDMVLGQWTIDQLPPSMRLAVDTRYVPVRYAPYNGPAVVPGWLREPPKRKRVCVTLGASFREVALGDQASIGDLIEAVADLDVEVVATLDDGQLAALPSVPDNVRAIGFVPLNSLLPTCSAVVHHSGSGTFSTALVHGVPQLIVPNMMWDSMDKAQALEASGAGLYVRDVDRLSGGELRAQLARLLDEPSFTAGAARVRAEMLGTPSPNDIVPLLEKLTAKHKERI